LTFQFCIVDTADSYADGKEQNMMKTLTFMCVILSCSCATGLDLDASKSHTRITIIFIHLHHLNNNGGPSGGLKNQKKFPSATSPLFIHIIISLAITNLPLCENMDFNQLFDLIQMSTHTTKLSFAT
jgi:hypothetical protein